MGLKEELGLKRGFSFQEHEAVLNIYYASNLIKKRAVEFFKPYNITDVQFNLLELLFYQGGEQGGLTQVDISKMMLVNRANITSLIDRMEKAGFVARTEVPGDRRYNIIKLTISGKTKLMEIEEAYAQEVKRIMGVLDNKEMDSLISMCEKIRIKLY